MSLEEFLSNKIKHLWCNVIKNNAFVNLNGSSFQLNRLKLPYLFIVKNITYSNIFMVHKYVMLSIQQFAQRKQVIKITSTQNTKKS